jgi:hypothetical protein
MPLTPLATPDDVAARLGRELSAQELTRCGVLLADISALVRRYCHRDFLMHTDETATFREHDAMITLPDQTTVSVSAVVAIGGNANLPDIPIPWYTFDGIDRIRLWPLHFVGNMPEIWWEAGAYPGTYDVTRTYGYADVPDDVMAFSANKVIGVVTAPTQASGVVGETIGPYSYRLERGGAGTGVTLSLDDKKALEVFRLDQVTIETRRR